jgi:hypothetical protein
MTSEAVENKAVSELTEEQARRLANLTAIASQKEIAEIRAEIATMRQGIIAEKSGMEEELARLRDENAKLLEALRYGLPFLRGAKRMAEPGSFIAVEKAEAAIRRAEEKCSCLPLPEPPNETCPIHGIEWHAK